MLENHSFASLYDPLAQNVLSSEVIGCTDQCTDQKLIHLGIGKCTVDKKISTSGEKGREGGHSGTKSILGAHLGFL